MNIWDLAVQERFRSVSKAYFRSAVGAVLVFDLTDRRSFDDLGLWFHDIEQLATPNCVVLLVGNKCDLDSERCIGLREATDFAKQHSIEYIEASAKSGANISETFARMAASIAARVELGQIMLSGVAGSRRAQVAPAMVALAEPDTERKGCC
jgi:small GTP-binding protein